MMQLRHIAAFVTLYLFCTAPGYLSAETPKDQSLKLSDIVEPNKNVIANPSFEIADGTGVSAWKTKTLSPSKDVQYLVETSGRSGKQCVSIRSDKGAQAAWTAIATAPEHTYYRLSGWIKTKDVTGEGARLVIREGSFARTIAIELPAGKTVDKSFR